jgi:hypothetical protein
MRMGRAADRYPQRLPTRSVASHHAIDATTPAPQPQLGMAPSTRLQKHPTRRVHYNAPTSRVGSRKNPIRLDDTPPPDDTAAQRNSPAPASRVIRVPTTRIKAGAVIKPKPSPQKVVKKSAVPKKKAPPVQRECSICASTKSVSHSFRLDKLDDACEHFKGICSGCIQALVKMKIASRQLTKSDLACPFPECDLVLNHATLRLAFTVKASFAE